MRAAQRVVALTESNPCLLPHAKSILQFEDPAAPGPTAFRALDFKPTATSGGGAGASSRAGAALPAGGDASRIFRRTGATSTARQVQPAGAAAVAGRAEVMSPILVGTPCELWEVPSAALVPAGGAAALPAQVRVAALLIAPRALLRTCVCAGHAHALGACRGFHSSACALRLIILCEPHQCTQRQLFYLPPAMRLQRFGARQPAGTGALKPEGTGDGAGPILSPALRGRTTTSEDHVAARRRSGSRGGARGAAGSSSVGPRAGALSAAPHGTPGSSTAGASAAALPDGALLPKPLCQGHMVRLPDPDAFCCAQRHLGWLF